MQITPKTDKELAEFGLWEKGQYDFECYEASDEVSKSSGAEMIKLKLKVYNAEGQMALLDDYLMDAMPHKLKHACQAMGIEDEYNKGKLVPYLFEGKKGKLELVVQKGKLKNKDEPNGDSWPDRNSVKDYVVGATAAIPSAEGADFDGDEVGF